MKKTFLATAFYLFIGGLALAEAGFFVTPMVEADFGPNVLYRGGSIACQAIYDIGGLGGGLEAKIGYDPAIASVNIPILAVISFTPFFYLMVGHTFGIGSAGVTINYAAADWILPIGYLAFPNTFGIGGKIVRIDLGFATLAMGLEISLTCLEILGVDNSSKSWALRGIFDDFPPGLKAGVFGGLEFKLQ